MADGYIQLPADDVGKKLDTSDVNMGAGSTSLHRERMVVADPSSTGGFAPVTSSGGLAVNPTNTVRSLSSGIVTLSSNPTVTLSSATSLSSGIVTLSSATSLSSGIVTLSSQHTVAVSSGLVSLTSGTVTLSSATSLSSGIVTLSSVHSVTSTASANPWSSAPGFNMPVVNASSGLVQISGTPIVVVASSSPITQTLTVVNTSSGRVQIAGNTAPFRFRNASSVGSISTAPGTLHTLVALSTAVAATGAYMRLYNLTTNNATSSNNSGLGSAVALLRISSSVASMPYEEAHFWPQGVYFDTACSFDIVTNATSTAASIGGWVTAQFTSSQ